MNEARKTESGYDVEEMGIGFVRLAGGATMDVMTAWALNLGKGLGCAVAGSLGGVQLPPINGAGGLEMKFYHTQGNYEFESGLNTASLARRWKNVEGEGDNYESSQHHWIRALQGKVDLLPTAEIALNMILIAEGIYLSSELGREVTADEILESSKQ
jgi:predicted dehydrogenase